MPAGSAIPFSKQQGVDKVNAEDKVYSDFDDDTSLSMEGDTSISSITNPTYQGGRQKWELLGQEESSHGFIFKQTCEMFRCIPVVCPQSQHPEQVHSP